MSSDSHSWDDTDIALIGMAGRFPGASTPGELWANVAAGVESIRALSDDELRRAGADVATLADPRYVKVAAVMDGVDLFDNGFFGFSPRDAAILDPQHRHFLESAWEALEDAGYDPAHFAGSIGVYAGCGMNSYFMFNLLTNPTLVSEVGLFLLRHTGNDKDFLATRLSYLLGLTGPSLGIQTACSTSLVAVHVACQQLLARECDMALAGGVTIEIPHAVGYRYADGEILSPDGRCRAFDAGANGTVFGSGAGVVVLRRMADAVEAGDHIRAVIKGSAINNDGAGKVSYFAPSVDGQAAAVREALSVSGVAVERLGYIEAHGTGTAVGDPIEIAALTQGLSATPIAPGSIAIGSLKSNIGHLDTAAGVAGLIKAVQALQHAQLPPSLHFTQLNSAIDAATTPFTVPTTLRTWPAPAGGPRVAAVNSLGVGGTNAHVILEEAPPRAPRAVADGHGLVVLSARTPAALETAAERLGRHLADRPDLALADVAFTLQSGRRAFPWRRAVAAASVAEAAAKLRDPAALVVVTGEASTARRVGYLLPGGGAQYLGMGRELFDREPVFREALTLCASLLAADGLPGLLEWIFPTVDGDAAAQRLEEPLPSVVSVVATEYAMSRLLASWGLEPAVLIGHSLGEYVAAHLAGVLSLRDALALAKCRGEIFARARGGMLSVALAEDALARRLPAGVSIAAANAPESTVASGPEAALAELERLLTADGIESQRVRINVAAHSAVLDPWLPEFRAALAGVALSPPRIPIVSSVTGRLAGAEIATADYWVRHLRETVRFGDAVRHAAATGPLAFVEVGPGRALSSFVAQCAVSAPAVPSMRHPRDPVSDQAAALAALGGLWAHGVDVDWTRLPHARGGRRVSLPTYPFERTRHWIEPGRSLMGAPATATLTRADDVSAWTWRPVWRERSSTGDSVAGTRHVLCCTHADGRSDGLVSALRHAGHRVDVVVAGGRGAGAGPFAWRAMIDRAFGGEATADVIVVDIFEASDPYDPVLGLTQAIGRADLDRQLSICLITRDLFAVGEDAPNGDPRQALATGPLAALAREHPGVRSVVLDVEAEPAGDTLARMVENVCTPPAEPLVGLRAGRRWVREFESVRLSPHGPRTRQGACLITGAFGGLGRLVATWAAEQRGGPLLLLGRQRPDDADSWLDGLRAAGAEPMLVEADLADAKALRRALDHVRGEVGPIDTVLHLAGRIDDGPLLSKTPQSTAAVLAPKVTGTLNLAAALESAPPSTMLLFSSTSAFLGLPGQADYAAANAFQAAFADSVLGRRIGARAIQWGAWKHVGMTGRPRLATATAPGAATLLGRTLASGPDGWAFEAVHSDTQWWYDEHRTTHGTALLPGTAYLELFHAAGRAISGSESMHLTDVAFVRPLELLAGESRRVVTRAEPRGERWHLTVTSETGDTGSSAVHAEAMLATEITAAAAVDLVGLERRCNRHVVDGATAMAEQSKHIRFGPRWQALRTVKRGATEAIAFMRLTADALRDLEAMAVHPALLDLSIVAGVGLVPGRHLGGLIMPFSIGRVRVLRRVNGETLAAYARLRDGSSTDVGRLDLAVTDLAGQPFYVVEDLAVRRLDGSLQATPAASAPSPSAALIDNGIAATEGLQVLGGLVDDDGAGRVVVASPFAPHDLVAAVDRWWPPLAITARQGPRRAVGDDLEADIAAIWGELLGVDRVDPDRDFFAAGGHSLLGVRLVSRIEKRLGHRLELSTLFTARTVRTQARAIRESGAPRWPTLVSLSTEGTRPPFFLVHAVDGQVLSFMELVRTSRSTALTGGARP